MAEQGLMTTAQCLMQSALRVALYWGLDMSPEAFLNRNVLFEARNLITL
jgi:hypothetical protein